MRIRAFFALALLLILFFVFYLELRLSRRRHNFFDNYFCSISTPCSTDSVDYRFIGLPLRDNDVSLPQYLGYINGFEQGIKLNYLVSESEPEGLRFGPSAPVSWFSWNYEGSICRIAVLGRQERYPVTNGHILYKVFIRKD